MRPKDEQKVEQIYKATLKLVAKYGLAGISMATIARDAGIGTGTLYTYFESKEDLIHQLYRHTRVNYGNILFADHVPSEPIRPAMKKIWLNYLNYRIDYYEESVLQDQYWVSPYLRDNVESRELTSQVLSPLKALLEKGIKEQLIKKTDMGLLIITMIGFISELAVFIKLKKFKKTATFTDEAFGLFWDAIKA